MTDTDPVREMSKRRTGNLPVTVGLPPKCGTGYTDQDDVVVIPALRAMHRLLGTD